MHLLDFLEDSDPTQVPSGIVRNGFGWSKSTGSSLVVFQGRVIEGDGLATDGPMTYLVSIQFLDGSW